MRSLWGLVSYAMSPKHTHADPAYFSTHTESLCDKEFDDMFLSTTPPETEEVNVNLDAMTPAELTAFIESKEKAHKDSQKAMRALLRAKIALAPKSKIEEEVSVG